MATSNAKPISFPVGRLVQGSLYAGNDKDDKGVTKVYKTGPNAGQPRTDFFFALAIPKNGTTDWKQTPWGAMIVAVAAASWPQGQSNHLSFAWKIVDGDSLIPNKRGTIPYNCEGFPGNWVLKFSGTYAPKTASALNGAAPAWVNTPDAIKVGDYIEVNAVVDGNNPSESPGIYLNYEAVCLRAVGAPIIVTRDVADMGFGTAPLPPIVTETAAVAGPPAAPAATTTAPPPPAPATDAPMPPSVDPRITDKARAAGAKTLEECLAWPNWTLPLLQANGFAV
jgi:hypothetical protein